MIRMSIIFISQLIEFSIDSYPIYVILWYEQVSVYNKKLFYKNPELIIHLIL